MKSIFYRINSPKNFDKISERKTKFNFFIYGFLFLIFILIIILVIVKDSKNRLTFVESKIEDNLELPFMFLTPSIAKTNISEFSLNMYDIDDINPSNIIDYCSFNVTNGNSGCVNSSNFFKPTLSGTSYTPVIKPVNITYERNYIKFISHINYPENIDSFELNNIKLMAIVIGNNHNLFNAPCMTQVLIRKEVSIDKNGVETIVLSPNFVMNPFFDDSCYSFSNSSEIIYNCLTIDITVMYESNIVMYYYEETDRQLITRIISDISSLSRLILYLLFGALTFLVSRFLFNQRTAWFSNSIRDGVLYHFNYYLIQPNLDVNEKERKSKTFISKLLSKFKNKNKDEIDLANRNDYSKLKDDEYYIFKKATLGSKNRFKRMFESIEPQDEYSARLSKISTIQLALFILSMIIVSIIIGIKNYNTRIAITQFENQNSIEIPKIYYNFINPNNELYWVSSNEILPNGESELCKNGDIIDCTTSKYFKTNNSAIINGLTATIEENTIFLNESQSYKLNYLVLINPNLNNYNFMNNLIIQLTINNTDYLLKPFSNNLVQLEKTVYHKIDGTNLTFYNANLFVYQIDPIVEPVVENNTTYVLIFGNTYLEIKYSDMQVKHIYEETNIELGTRILQYIMSFASPLSLFYSLIFTYIVIRLLFKSPSAHTERKVREGIIYFMKYYNHYPEIFDK